MQKHQCFAVCTFRSVYLSAYFVFFRKLFFRALNQEIFAPALQVTTDEIGESRLRRNFVSEIGAISQEYFVYFKKLQRIYGAKFPQHAEGAVHQWLLKGKQNDPTYLCIR